MLRSMTGYGQAEIDTERFTIKAEFKSLNNKFLEVSLRLPKIWQSLEHEVRKEITKLVDFRDFWNLTVKQSIPDDFISV